MIPQADKLIERARSGEVLTAKERRHCLAYLQITQPEATNAELGQLFNVSDTMIRLDKKKIREERAALIKEDDIALVIADIAISFENQVRDIESSKKKCKVGSKTYLDHCTAIFKMRLQQVQALQELGYYPKNLGNMTVDKFEYKAIVHQDGSVDTRKVDLVIEDTPDDQGSIIDAEFEDVRPKELAAPENPVEEKCST